MSEHFTTRSRSATPAAEIATLSKRQVLALVVISCLPVPALTYTAGLMPLPELISRAAASFVPFIEPASATGDVRAVRAEEARLAVLEIRGSDVGSSDAEATAGARPARAFVAIPRADGAPRPGPVATGGPGTQDDDVDPAATPPTDRGDTRPPKPVPPGLDTPDGGPEGPSDRPAPKPKPPTANPPDVGGGGGGGGGGGTPPDRRVPGEKPPDTGTPPSPPGNGPGGGASPPGGGDKAPPEPSPPSPPGASPPEAPGPPTDRAPDPPAGGGRP